MGRPSDDGKVTLLRIILIIIAILAISSAQLGNADDIIKPENGCKDNPTLVADCFTIHGRIFASNGNPGVRIWPIGTKRHIGVLHSENEVMPEVIKKYITFGTNIYGDFLVCPFSKAREGWMQFVCIESASNLVVEKYSLEKPESPPVVFRIKGDYSLGK